MYEFAQIRTRVASDTGEKRYDVRASEKIFECRDLVWKRRKGLSNLIKLVHVFNFEQ